jgi:hypothetical protein
MSLRRHSWRHVNPPVCRHNARPVFGSASGKGARAIDCSSGKAAADDPPPPRHLLPRDLAGALRQLDDREIDALLSAVTTEAKRRGRLTAQRPKEKFAPDAKAQTHQAPAEDGAGSLTTGKLSAVRAAFKAGVKPSAIARQFGISQSDVRKALATERRDRKSSR